MRIDTKTPYRRLANRAGFSAVELVTALGLGLVVVGAAAAFNHYQLSLLRNQAEQVDLQITARALVDLIARDVRLAGANPDCNGGLTAIPIAKKNAIAIMSDRDGDGVLTGLNERLLYRFVPAEHAIYRVDAATAGGSLSLDEATGDAIAEGLGFAGSGFRYFDGNHDELDPGTDGLTNAQRDAIRRVRVEVVLRDSRSGDTADTVTASASTNVDLRNRFFVDTNTWCTAGGGQATP